MGRKNESKVHAFLSYVSVDRGVAESLAQLLSENGVVVWLDHHELRPGAAWMAEIDRALQLSDLIFLLISPEFLKSPWANLEAGMALRREYESPGTRLILVLTKGVTPDLLPPLLSHHQAIDATKIDPGELRHKISEIVRDPRAQSEKGR